MNKLKERATIAVTPSSLLDDGSPPVRIELNRFLWTYKGAEFMFVILGKRCIIRLRSIRFAIVQGGNILGNLEDGLNWVRKNF